MNTLGCAQITRFTAYCWGNCLCLHVYKRESIIFVYRLHSSYSPLRLYAYLCGRFFCCWYLIMHISKKKNHFMRNWSKIDWSIVVAVYHRLVYRAIMEAKTWKSMSKHVKRTSLLLMQRICGGEIRVYATSWLFNQFVAEWLWIRHYALNCFMLSYRYYYPWWSY